jgi:hypothetical protein
MTNDSKIPPDSDDRPEESRPQQSGHDAQQHQTSVPGSPGQPGQRAAPGRKPLFRS